MAFGYDGSVRIKADLDHRAFDRGLSSMTGQVNKFSKTLTNIAKTVAVAFGTAALVNFSREAVKAASALNDAWMGLQSIVEGQGRSFSKAKSFINDYISDGLVPLQNAVTAYKNLAARGYSTEQIEQTLTALKDAAAFGRQASYSLGEAVTSATEGLKNENSILVDNAGVTKNVAKMWDEYARSIGTTANNLTQAQKIQAEVNGILNETRFQTGDAAKLTTTYSGQIAMLGYNFQQLKVQVGNALLPIAQAVLPGINAIIAGLTKLARVFAQVTALLFGKPNTGVSTQVSTNEQVTSSSLEAADATDKLAESTAGAGSASKKTAKEMKGVLASFDELNILADSAADSMEGAAGGFDAGEIDTTMPELDMDGGAVEEIGERFKSLGEIFRDILDDMLAGIPRLREAFLDFADGLNGINQKLYDAFKFDGVLERVEMLGRELAKAFNDLVNAIDWELWGRTLGAGLNLGLQFLTEFIYTFDWVNLGKKLAEFINGLVYEVDWYDFGRLLWAQFKIGLETFAGFITGLDMPALAQAASNIIMGFFDEMKNTIARIDWGEIGKQIAEFLNNIDWIGVIKSIAGALKEMVAAALEFIGGFISNADPETLLVAAALLGGKILKGIIAKVISPIAKEVASNLIKGIAAALSGSGLGGIVEKVGSVVGKIVAVIGKIGPAIVGIGTFIAGVWTSVTAFLDMWNNGFSLAKEAVMLVGIAIAAVGATLLGVPATVAAIVAGIVAAVATAVILIKEHWGEIKEAAIAVWEAIKEAWGNAGAWFDEHVIQPVKEFFGGLWETISTKASETWQGIQDTWTAVSSWFNENVTTPVKDFFTDMWGNVKQAASDTKTDIENTWNKVSGWFEENVTKPVGEFFDGLWKDVTKWAEDTWNNNQETWKEAPTWFTDNVVTPVGEFFDGLWKDITQWAKDTWDDNKETWKDSPTWFTDNVTTPIGDFFGDMWDDIKKKGGSAWEDIQNAWEGASSWFEENVTKPIGDFFRNLWQDIRAKWADITSGPSGGAGRYTSSNGMHYGPRMAPETYSVRSIPKLANGAVIPPNQQFAAILGDQRSGVNVEAPLSTIRQAVTEALQASGGLSGNGGNVTVIMEIDGREFGRASYKYGSAERQRVGVRLTEVRT